MSIPEKIFFLYLNEQCNQYPRVVGSHNQPDKHNAPPHRLQRSSPRGRQLPRMEQRHQRPYASLRSNILLNFISVILAQRVLGREHSVQIGAVPRLCIGCRAGPWHRAWTNIEYGSLSGPLDVTLYYGYAGVVKVFLERDIGFDEDPKRMISSVNGIIEIGD